MIDIKNIVYESLLKVCENVSDTAPNDTSTLPAIRCLEEDNRVEEWTDNQEQSSYIRYRLDLWDNNSTAALASAVDKQITEDIGLVRMQCFDVEDASGRKHKTIRYEGIITKNANQEIEIYHQKKE